LTSVEPTAHASFTDFAHTPRNESYEPDKGTGTDLQAFPSQCNAAAGRGTAGESNEYPTAHASFGASALTPVRTTPSRTGSPTARAILLHVLPSQCNIIGRITVAPSRNRSIQPAAHTSFAATALTAFRPA
jgi:hypothetical protein